MEITRKEYDALTKAEQEVLDKAGITIVEEKGLEDSEVKSIVDEVLEPVKKELDEIKEKQIVFAQAAQKQPEFDPIEIGGIKIKELAGAKLTPREKQQVTTYSGYVTAADGGNLMDRSFLDIIVQHAILDDQILNRLNIQRIPRGRTLIVPTDNLMPWNLGTSEGINSEWGSEAARKEQTKMSVGQVSISLEKENVLVPVSDELLEYTAIQVGQYVMKKSVDYLNGRLLHAITVGGSAAGGITPMLTDPSRIVVNRASARNIVWEDIVEMYKQMWPTSLAKGAFWIYNPQAIGELLNIQDNAGRFVFVGPTTDVTAAPSGRLLGLPIVPCGYCPQVGQTGDLMLVDGNQYFLGVTETKQSVSEDFAFDQDVTTFRTVLAGAGRFWTSAPYTAGTGDQYSYDIVLGPATSSS